MGGNSFAELVRLVGVTPCARHDRDLSVEIWYLTLVPTQVPQAGRGNGICSGARKKCERSWEVARTSTSQRG